MVFLIVFLSSIIFQQMYSNLEHASNLMVEFPTGKTE